ncbi:MAG: efflux RND transporter periplasmic adaptor subunit [Sulfurimonas sp.]|nr:efflux RND transporter periplasmic adaptor subunit [Sulfurimonas sp.]
MKKFYILIFLSILGLAIGILTIFYGDTLKSSNTVPIPYMKLPFKSFIAGTGTVESGSKNIHVGSQVSGVVRKAYVQSGDKIKKGDILFELDSSDIKYKILVAKANIKASKTQYFSAKHQFELVEDFKKIDVKMVTTEKYTKAQDDLKEAEALVDFANAKLIALQNELKLYMIYSPIDGIVLQSEISDGEFFDKNSKAFIIGSDKLNVRASINEYDIWKFKPNTKAVAFVRGDTKQTVDLKYNYTIPNVIAKTNLTGLGTEKTDTRVLQIIYSIENKTKFPIYVGEQLDVFIKIQDR